ncbi:DUF4296 domain-containing protein [Hymenobacter sp. BT664]|uniref:DUF4296 domain-containing protein n=1 Tax=Hymenobacter montanus TaxID=2771359 RepID=A0A927BGT2_9BACT|nr:DUF4296 domain-containing protein [Hymenobacter montanus]MBD2769995.1 DUF4296 domain-containing protein [Hymenobacter montanus]
MKSFHRRYLGLLLAPLLLVVPACERPEEPPQPEELLPKEKMIPILADLQVLEARVENSHLRPDSAQALFQAQQKSLFWQQSITDSAFHRSYRYYGMHGKDLEEIYQVVIDTLNQRAAKLEYYSKPNPTPAR